NEHWSRSAGAETTRTLIDDGVRFDAIFALNDTLGLGALRALGEAGLRVPEDVDVIGFDNTDEAEFSMPSLTSVDIGREQIATEPVDLLIERIGEKRSHRAPRTVTPEFQTLRPQSTAISRRRR